MIDLSGKQIKSIYHEEQKMFEKVKHVLIPKHMLEQEEEEMEERGYNYHEHGCEYDGDKYSAQESKRGV